MRDANTTTQSDRSSLGALDRIRHWIARERPPSPCLVIDLDTVAANHAAVRAAFGPLRVSYAVKANPSPLIVAVLAEHGASFDVASVGEIDLCLSQRIAPTSLSFGNTVKKASDIAAAHAAGVAEFAFDTADDLHNLARHAPGARVLCRLRVDAPSSVTPFGGKFGCQEHEAVQLLALAAELGLDATGVAFHVGSQQLDVTAWRPGIAAATRVFTACAARGVRLRALNLGGGFAVDYRAPAPSLERYAGAIHAALRAHFPESTPELTVEPGRALVATAGLIRTQVILVARRAGHGDHLWVYLDAGRYNGLAETENEAITYRLVPVTHTSDVPDSPVIIAGPTCDGDDVLYQRTPYRLPLALRPGDELDILNAGAYTASYSSIAFNGIPPLRTYCLSEGRLVDAG